MDEKKVEKLLEVSVLPALLQTLKAVSELSTRQAQSQSQILDTVKQELLPNEWKEMLLDTVQRLNAESDMSGAIKVSIEKMAAIDSTLTALVDSTNELVQLQVEQKVILENLTSAFAENTSRLDVLTLAIQNNTGNVPLGAIYEQLTQSTHQD